MLEIDKPKRQKRKDDMEDMGRNNNKTQQSYTVGKARI